MSGVTRPLAALAALVLLLSACGGAASPAAPAGGSQAPGATTAPAASEAPAPSDATPTVAPSTGAAGPDIAGAATALADLDSYHLKIAMSMQGLEQSMFAAFGDGLEMEGTVVFKPVRAADMTISMGTAAQKIDMGYRIIGDKAWVSLGDGWTATPADSADSMITSLSPEKLMGSFGSMPGMAAVGDETKNGVETVHYAASGDEIGAMLGSSLGLPGADWTVDLWVAKDGGYAVSYLITGQGANGKFEMAVDVTDINSPANTIEPPAGG